MVEVELVAFPVLLAASYGVYRVGRRRDAGARAFDTVRLAFQGALIGVVAAVSVKLIQTGSLEMPIGLLAPGLAIPGLVGLVVMDFYLISHPAVDPRSQPSADLDAASVVSSRL